MPERNRCAWAGNPLAIDYHDREWGVPVQDDRRLFELLILEGAQAGLSWNTILRKREHYRRVFDGFDAVRVACYDSNRKAELLADPGIVRNRAKIEASVGNAQAFLTVQREFGSFANFVWSFVGGKPLQNDWQDAAEVPARSEVSDRLSAELKKRGFKFVGTTIVYAFMQAVGMVNDHCTYCFRHIQLRNRR